MLNVKQYRLKCWLYVDPPTVLWELTCIMQKYALMTYIYIYKNIILALMVDNMIVFQVESPRRKRYYLTYSTQPNLN